MIMSIKHIRINLKNLSKSKKKNIGYSKKSIIFVVLNMI